MQHTRTHPMMQLNEPISAERLCRRLGLELDGPSRDITEICSLDSLVAGGLSFVLRSRQASGLRTGTVFGAPELGSDGASVIRTDNPRLDFIRAQHLLDKNPGFRLPAAPPDIHPTVLVGANSVIENGVSIGEGTVIGSCVVIKSGTRIGRFCDVKSGTVIGEPGFGFERMPDGRPIRMIHLGGVKIGDHVEIGALCTVARGALGDTVLASHVKVDDHAHIAHNCRIGEGTIITAHAILSGSIKVGKNCWIAPNSSIVQKIELGDDSFIGIGAAVVRSVEPRAKMFGNPARPM